MTRLLQFLVLTSMLFTATVATSGIDLGAPNCHTMAMQQHRHSAGAHSDVWQLKAGCNCSCPCCNYVAHLIPLAFTLVFEIPAGPQDLYASSHSNWYSLASPPPFRPPRA